MEIKKIIVPGIILAGLIWAYQKFSLFKGIVFSITNVSFSGGILNPQLVVTVNAKNPTNATATLQMIKGKIYNNGTELIGEVIKYDTILIAANSDVPIDLPITIAFNLVF